MANRTLKRLLLGELSIKRFIRSMLLIPLLIYLCLIIFALFFSDSLIFQPPSSGYQDPEEFLKLQTKTGKRISAIYLPYEKATYTVLYSHGNAEDLSGMRPVLEEIRKWGFNVFAYDYQGYGSSEGKPSESNAYDDVDAAYEYLTATLQIPPEQIIAYGHSVGSAVAVDLASRKPLGALIVESGFITAFRVVTRVPILPFDKFRNLAKIGNLNCPVLISHGKQDTVVASWHSEKLFEFASQPTRLILLEGAGHNDVMLFVGKRYLEGLHELGLSINE
jgi:alpha-beta hydrolase superfamily lysophospholipase